MSDTNKFVPNPHYVPPSGSPERKKFRFPRVDNYNRTEDHPDYGRITHLPIHSRATDPETSMPGGKDNTEDQRNIIALLHQYPEGLNSREISEALNRPRECITPCLRPMARSGHLRVLGKRYDFVTNCTVLIWGIE
jgi:hypothetical protein